MRLRELMRTNLSRARRDTPFGELVAAHRRRDSRLVYVVDEADRLLGVVSCYDLLRAALPFYVDSGLARALPEDDTVVRDGFAAACRAKTAGDVMTSRHVTVSPDDTVFAAEAYFAEGRHNVLPVIDATGRVVGEVTRRTILVVLAGSCGL